MSDRSPRTIQYERALRWYPAEWRRQHGPALVSDLMEQDDARGRRSPSVADRLSLLAQGLRTRSLRPAAPSSAALMLRLVALAGAAFVAIWYWTTSPVDVFSTLPAGSSLLVSHEPKSILDHGTVIPAMLLTLGLAASLARRDVLARILGGIAALTALVITELATGTWGGPDLPIGTILITFGLMSAVRVDRWLAVLGFVALLAGIFLLELRFSGAPPLLAPAASACFLLTAAIGALAVLHHLRRRHDNHKNPKPET